MMQKLKNIHPGDILKSDFLDEMNITSLDLAKAIDVDQILINQIVSGNHDIDADIALKLGDLFNVSPHFWIHIQSRFDLEKTK